MSTAIWLCSSIHSGVPSLAGWIHDLVEHDGAIERQPQTPDPRLERASTCSLGSRAMATKSTRNYVCLSVGLPKRTCADASAAPPASSMPPIRTSASRGRLRNESRFVMGLDLIRGQSIRIDRDFVD